MDSVKNIIENYSLIKTDELEKLKESADKHYEICMVIHYHPELDEVGKFREINNIITVRNWKKK